MYAVSGKTGRLSFQSWSFPHIGWQGCGKARKYASFNQSCYCQTYKILAIVHPALSMMSYVGVCTLNDSMHRNFLFPNQRLLPITLKIILIPLWRALLFSCTGIAYPSERKLNVQHRTNKNQDISVHMMQQWFWCIKPLMMSTCLLYIFVNITYMIHNQAMHCMYQIKIDTICLYVADKFYVRLNCIPPDVCC